jgi:uncharacterized protein (TIGR03435 family)
MTHKVFALGGILLALATVVALGQARSPNVRAQFEVASIKPHPGIDNLVHIQPSPGGRLVVENLSLRQLVQNAYGVQSFQISGGPGWTNSDLYDIEAKAEGSPSGKQMTGPMLQTLLEDRFKLRLHRETRLLPVYELKVEKGGMKLPRSKEGGCVPFSMDSPALPPMRVRGERRTNFCGFLGFGMEGTDRKLEMAGVSMAELTTSLSRGELRRTVIDKTGLVGTFDVNLHWTIDVVQANPGTSGEPSPSPAVNLTGPSIFAAIQEQLGLKLEAAKGPVEVLVVDHIERPSAN